MAQFIHIDTFFDMFRSRPDIATELNKRISEGRQAYNLVQEENSRAMNEAETEVQKAEAQARYADARATFLREEANARQYLSTAARNESLSGLDLLWQGLWG